MLQTFTSAFMADNCGCYDSDQLAACSFMKNDPILLSDIITSEIPLRDKFWFICKKLASKEENQQIAIRVAEIVLPIYEKRYPDNKTPREAIEAAKQFIAGHISLEELRKKRADAAAAYEATYAATAGDAAAAAADAADAASANAASYAAAAADAAAAAANAAAAYEKDIKKELDDYLLTFVEKELAVS